MTALIELRDDLDEERCGPVSLREELRFRHEHDLNNTPGYRDSLLCRRTELALAKTGPKAVAFRALLNGERFRFKENGPVFLRDKTFFRTLPDGDNGRAFPADMNAIVFPDAPEPMPDRILLEDGASLRKLDGRGWGFFRGDVKMRHLSEFEVEHIQAVYRAGHAAGALATTHKGSK